jgi:hypothetical protein
MNEKLARALLVGGPVVFVLAKRLPPGQGLRLPLMFLGGVALAASAWKTYSSSVE